MSEVVKRYDYSQQEIQEALAVFAYGNGQEREVVPLLEEAGLKVKLPTLRTWAYKSKRDLYTQISAEVEKAKKLHLTDRFAAIAELATGISVRVMGELEARLDGMNEISTKELLAILRESGVQGGIATDKLLLLTGNPTQIVQQQLPDLARALKAKGVTLTIQGEDIIEEDVTV